MSNDQKHERGAMLPLELPSNVTRLPSAQRREKLRILEALLFAATEPLDVASLRQYFDQGEDLDALLSELQGHYAGRGVNIVKVVGGWQFRTAEDLAFILERHAVDQRKLSRAALETLAIIAYHQPCTRAEVEEIRGVSTSKGTLDVLMETGWIRMRGRRRAPGRPVTYGTTDSFLEHFGFDNIRDLPGLNELRGAGLLDSNLPPGFTVPQPDDSLSLTAEEDPLEEDDEPEDENGGDDVPLAEDDEQPDDPAAKDRASGTGQAGSAG